MLCGMKNPCGLKVRRCTDFMIYLNEYLSVFPGAKASDKTCETELNEILLNIMPNIWNSQAHVQGFDCETINKIYKTCLNACKYQNIFMKVL